LNQVLRNLAVIIDVCSAGPTLLPTGGDGPFYGSGLCLPF